MEIDQEADVQIEQSQMRQQLSLVNGVERFFAFDLDDDGSVNDQIGAKAAFQFHSPINQRHSFLALYVES
jgi:hypothetical protein